MAGTPRSSASLEKWHDALKRNINLKIKKYRGAKNKYRNWAFGLYIAVALLTATTSLLSGGAEFFSNGDTSHINITILIISSSLFVINAGMAFFNHREGYDVFRRGLNEMRVLGTKLELANAKGLTEARLEELNNEYISIVQYVDHSQQDIRSATGEGN